MQNSTCEMYIATSGSGKVPKREGLMMFDSAPFSMNCAAQKVFVHSASSVPYRALQQHEESHSHILIRFPRTEVVR